MTRHCSMSVACADSWDKVFQLDVHCIKEILFWKKNTCTMNERDCFLRCGPNRFVYSDASETGCGATVTLNEEQVCHKMWDETEGFQSSTWRELVAIIFYLVSFAGLIRHSHVKWYTDNQAVAKIIEVNKGRFRFKPISAFVYTFAFHQSKRFKF